MKQGGQDNFGREENSVEILTQGSWLRNIELGRQR